MYIDFIQSSVYRLYPRPPPHPPTHACKAYFSATPKDGDTIAWLSIWLSHSAGDIREGLLVYTLFSILRSLYSNLLLSRWWVKFHTELQYVFGESVKFPVPY